MKISDIGDCLRSYDLNKGTMFRSWVDESHIRELRRFHAELNTEKDRDLSSQELKRTAEIILSKTTWTNTESCITLSMLANRMGGKKALDYLKEEGQLKAEYLVELEYYTSRERQRLISQEMAKESTDRLSQQGHHVAMIEGYGVLIAKYLISLKAVIPPAQIRETAILENVATTILAKKIEDIKKLVHGKVIRKAAYLAIFASEDAQQLADVLVLLQKSGLCKDSNIEKLPTGKGQLELLESILTIFAETDEMLMLQTNLTALLESSNRLARYFEIIIELSKAKSLNPPLIKMLFSPEFDFEKGELVAGLIAQFRESGWDVIEHFGAILKAGESAKDILAALVMLRKFALKEPHQQLVLPSLFAAPQYSKRIIRGLDHLCRNLEAHTIDEEEIKTILGSPQYARKLAGAIELKRFFASTNDGTKECIDKCIASNPGCADQLALVLVQLAEENFNTPETRELILTQPKNAGFAVLILGGMKQQGLLKTDNPNSLNNLKSLYAKDFMSAEFFKFSCHLMSLNLYNQANFEKLVDNAMYFERIATSCFKLKDKLNQTSLDRFFNDPANALLIANILNAEAYQEQVPSIEVERVPEKISPQIGRDNFFKSAQTAKPQLRLMDDAKVEQESNLGPLGGVKRIWGAFKAAVDSLHDDDSSEEESYEVKNKYFG
jgi:hypothetical protein